MDDALRKFADDRERFRLHEFAEMELVELAEPVADLLEQGEGQSGRAFDEGQHLAARQKIDLRVHGGRSRGGTGAMFNDGHFAKNFTGAEPVWCAASRKTKEFRVFYVPHLRNLR